LFEPVAFFSLLWPSDGSSAAPSFPAFGEEAPSAAKGAEIPPLVPSLADVVYQSGSLNNGSTY
jgi:hypothetical protein